MRKNKVIQGFAQKNNSNNFSFKGLKEKFLDTSNPVLHGIARRVINSVDRATETVFDSVIDNVAHPIKSIGGFASEFGKVAAVTTLSLPIGFVGFAATQEGVEMHNNGEVISNIEDFRQFVCEQVPERLGENSKAVYESFDAGFK